jgi:catechol 2,3-dioxygenase-like lactoylglutathione lyase family enzyme
MFTVKRLNHIVLYVRDAQHARAFYQDVLGFVVVETMGDQAVFLRANGSDDHHD